MSKRLFIIICLVCLGCLASMTIYQQLQVQAQAMRGQQGVTVVDSEKTKPQIQTITLTAAGDCLMHGPQIRSGLQADGSFCFDNFFVDVKDLINDGDYSSTDFEAALAGPETGYTGYPMFNSPDAIATTFKEAGFDLVVTVNNHSLDRGYKGAIRTLDVLQKAGLDTVGTYRNEKEARSFLIKDIKGVKVGYLAYSYGTNGLPVPGEHPEFFNFLDRDKILTDIEILRPQVDVLILVLHWGQEYQPKPTQEQELMAHEFLNAGADVILGNHPHVIQTMEIVKVRNKDKFVIYSMGNFISAQHGQERNSGIVLKMKFTKNFNSSETLLDEVTYTPTYSHPYYEQGKLKYRVIPVEAGIERIKQGQDPFMNERDLPVLEAVLQSTRGQLGEPYYRIY
ncbi:MAG: CapA family protein [Syntrophomonadaceae bacterium]|nr:CapA family protein [Syntrophomonadaceae bacterium]MDD3271961.1 CapA family protein [Syntrophomonadaceae bacterium]